MRRKSMKGFTLLEMLIVVVLIGIVGGIAFSAFQDSGADARRMRAISDLQALNDAVGRYYQVRFTYEGAEDIDAIVADAGITLSEDYDYVIDPSDDGQAYQVRAVPVADGLQAGDGALMMDNTGRQCLYAEKDSPDFSECPAHF